MIKITKSKTEMRECAPIKIITVEIDLEDVQSNSKNMTPDQLKLALGNTIFKHIENITKCVQPTTL